MKYSVLSAVAAYLLCATAALADSSPANAPEAMTHNGSDMKLYWDDGAGYTCEIVYENPRPGLSAKKGTVLIEGAVTDVGQVEATARVFKKGCSPAPYRVTGWFEDKGILRLSGDAPVFKAGTCEVVDYEENQNSVLIFERVR